LYRRLSGPQSRSGRYGEEKTSYPCREWKSKSSAVHPVVAYPLHQLSYPDSGYKQKTRGNLEEFLATDPDFSGSIPGASRFFEKQQLRNWVHSASGGQLRSYLEDIVAAPVKKPETNDRGDSLR
jgi:hypothetical protein